MDIKNKKLMNGANRIRNKISADKSKVIFTNVHNAGNQIKIEGEGSLLSFEGNEGYLRYGKVVVDGQNNNIRIGNASTLTGGCSFRIIGNNNTVKIGQNSSLLGFSIYILGNNNHITIGNNVSVVLTSLHIEESENSVVIGNCTTFHGRDNSIIELALDEGTSIKIGEDCMISNDVCFRSSDSHSILNENGERINPAGDIVISNHVWIGMRSLILKNTVISANCIIGAGSICNKDYKKDNCLIAGNPAKIIKEKVNWSRERL